MDEVFKCWTTVADFARDIGVDPVRARQWKNRRSIPASYDKRIVAVAEHRAFPITLEKLADLRASEAGVPPYTADTLPPRT